MAGWMAHQLRALASFKRILVWFPTPMWWLTPICNSSCRVSRALFWPLRAPDTHTVYRHTCRQNTHIQKILKQMYKQTHNRPKNKSKSKVEGDSIRCLLLSERGKCVDTGFRKCLVCIRAYCGPRMRHTHKQVNTTVFQRCGLATPRRWGAKPNNLCILSQVLTV